MDGKIIGMGFAKGIAIGIRAEVHRVKDVAKKIAERASNGEPDRRDRLRDGLQRLGSNAAQIMENPDLGR